MVILKVGWDKLFKTIKMYIDVHASKEVESISISF